MIAFDHNLRSRALAKAKLHEAQLPVVFAHNDYTETSGPQRVRDLVPDEAESLIKNRFAVINVWRPTRAPVEESPLAVLDAQSMGPDDLVSMDLIYVDRIGEIQSLKYDPKHRWLYLRTNDAGRSHAAQVLRLVSRRTSALYGAYGLHASQHTRRCDAARKC